MRSPLLATVRVVILAGVVLAVLTAAHAAQGSSPATGWRAYTFYAIGLAAGILFRTLVPLLVQWQQNPDLHWERKYWLPPIIATIISIPAVFMGLASLNPPTGGLAGKLPHGNGPVESTGVLALPAD